MTNDEKKRMTLPGSDVEVVVSPAEEIAKHEADPNADVILVCCYADTPTHFNDNIITQCSECGIDIRERPHNPKNARRLCFHCALPLIEHARNGGEELHVTEASVKEAGLGEKQN